MTRTDLLNALVQTHGYRLYLEIGVRNPADNLERITAGIRVGVDPILGTGPAQDGSGRQYYLYGLASDGFFPCWRDYPDLVFIDGDHREAQVALDLGHAMAILAPGGTIVLHDCLPRSAEAVLPEKPANGAPWNGTAYRVWLQACRDRTIRTVCVDADHGLGVIQRRPTLYTSAPPAVYSFREYLLRQADWSHAVQPREFLDMLTDGRL